MIVVAIIVDVIFIVIQSQWRVCVSMLKKPQICHFFSMADQRAEKNKFFLDVASFESDGWALCHVVYVQAHTHTNTT